MTTWILVFWLQFPQNYTEYTEYTTERLCRESQHKWQQRLQIVGSKLQAECRERRL